MGWVVTPGDLQRDVPHTKKFDGARGILLERGGAMVFVASCC